VRTPQALSLVVARQVDFTTLFETVYELLCVDDHAAMRRVLLDANCTSAADVTGQFGDLVDEKSSRSASTDDATSQADAAAAAADVDDDDDPDDDREVLFLVCRMHAATSTRRVSSVASKAYQLKVWSISLSRCTCI